MYPPPPEPQSFKATSLESRQKSQRFLNDSGISRLNKFNVDADKDFISLKRFIESFFKKKSI